MATLIEDEDRVCDIIDELYQELEKGEGAGPVLRFLAKSVLETRNEEVAKMIAFLQKRGVKVDILAALQDGAHRRC